VSDVAVAEPRPHQPEARPAVLTGLVVSHTHWDREWYQTFEIFRMRLVDTIDLVLDILDERADFRAFTLDGQAVLLEDYLAVRPENDGRIERHVRSGRLLIGPWYVLADGFLASGESLVRNLLMGRAVCAKYGPAMNVGYLPDTFGHPSQIPQLLAGFGIETAVVYRGVRSGRSEFWWEGPDGSKVLAMYLPEGYCNANVLSASPHLFTERMPPVIERLRRAATTPYVLVMNGCDHMSPRPELADAIADINRHLEGTIQLRQGTLEEFAGFVRDARPRLEILRGEFRAGRPARVTPGVISTRAYLKLENFRAYTTLERAAEPLCALAWLMGAAYPTSYLEYVWRRLLQNTPHDSITGCSVDRVHREMMTRFALVNEVSQELAHRGAAAIARGVGASQAEGPSGYLTFNTLPTPRQEHVRQRLQFLEPETEFHLVDASGDEVPFQTLGRRPARIEFSARFERFDREAREYPVVLGLEGRRRAEILRESRWQRWEGEEVDLLFAADLPPCGYATFQVIAGRAPQAPKTDLRYGEDWAENDFIRVRVHPDGTFDLTDKRTQTAFERLGALESGGDRGDEYNFCPPEEDLVATTLGGAGEVARVESGPLRATFEVRRSFAVPAELAPDRRRRSERMIEIPLLTSISVSAGRERVEVTMTVQNVARDHRLRAVFPAPVRTDVAHAQGQFTVDIRNIDVPEAEKRRVPDKEEELEVATYPHKAFVDVNDGRRGLAVLNRGITEYQVEPTAGGVRVCLTLLRCVGWLSRSDLWTRNGPAGPAIATPDAQCPGEHVFEYAVAPHAGGWLDAGVHQQAEAYVTPVHSAAVTGLADDPATGSPTAGAEGGFISVEPAELVFSALKKADRSDTLVLRFYNAAPHEVSARIRFGWRPAEVRRADLAEQPVGPPLRLDGSGSVGFPVRPSQIVTLWIAR
jgi:mannosylglycerate hydrolase